LHGIIADTSKPMDRCRDVQRHILLMNHALKKTHHWTENVYQKKIKVHISTKWGWCTHHYGMPLQKQCILIVIVSITSIPQQTPDLAPLYSNIYR